MSWFTIKLDKADRLFSRYIRLRDGRCVRCLRNGRGTEDREEYRLFKERQLGEKGLELLNIRAETPQKKDRKLAMMYWAQRLKEFEREVKAEGVRCF